MSTLKYVYCLAPQPRLTLSDGMGPNWKDMLTIAIDPHLRVLTLPRKLYHRPIALGTAFGWISYDDWERGVLLPHYGLSKLSRAIPNALTAFDVRQTLDTTGELNRAGRRGQYTRHARLPLLTERVNSSEHNGSKCKYHKCKPLPLNRPRHASTNWQHDVAVDWTGSRDRLIVIVCTGAYKIGRSKRLGLM